MWSPKKKKKSPNVHNNLYVFSDPIKFDSDTTALRYNLADDFNRHFSGFVPTKVGHAVVAEKVRMTTVLPYPGEKDSWGRQPKPQVHVKPTKVIRSSEPPSTPLRPQSEIKRETTAVGVEAKEDTLQEEEMRFEGREATVKSRKKTTTTRPKTMKGTLGGQAAVTFDDEGRVRFTEEGYRTSHSSNTFKCKFLSKPPQEENVRQSVAALVFRDNEEDERQRLIAQLPGVSDFVNERREVEVSLQLKLNSLGGGFDAMSDAGVVSPPLSPSVAATTPGRRKSRAGSGGVSRRGTTVMFDPSKGEGERVQERIKREDLVYEAISAQVSEQLRMNIDGSSLLPPPPSGSCRGGPALTTLGSHSSNQPIKPKLVALSEDHGMRVTDRHQGKRQSLVGQEEEGRCASGTPFVPTVAPQLSLAVHVGLEDQLVFPAGSASTGTVRVLVVVPLGSVAKITRRTLPLGVSFSREAEERAKRTEIPRGSPLDLLRRKLKRSEEGEKGTPGSASRKVFADRAPTLLHNASPMTLAVVPLDGTGRCLLDPAEDRTVEEIVLLQECRAVHDHRRRQYLQQRDEEGQRRRERDAQRVVTSAQIKRRRKQSIAFNSSLGSVNSNQVLLGSHHQRQEQRDNQEESLNTSISTTGSSSPRLGSSSGGSGGTTANPATPAALDTSISNTTTHSPITSNNGTQVSKPTMVEVTTDSFYLGSDSTSLWVVAGDNNNNNDAQQADSSEGRSVQEAMRAFANGEETPSSFRWTSRFSGVKVSDKLTSQEHDEGKIQTISSSAISASPPPFAVITQELREKSFRPNYDLDEFQAEKYEAEVLAEVHKGEVQQQQHTILNGAASSSVGGRRHTPEARLSLPKGRGEGGNRNFSPSLRSSLPPYSSSVDTCVPLHVAEYLTLKQSLTVGFRQGIEDAYASGVRQVELQGRQEAPVGRKLAIDEKQDQILGIVSRPAQCLLKVDGGGGGVCEPTSLLRLGFPKSKDISCNPSAPDHRLPQAAAGLTTISHEQIHPHHQVSCPPSSWGVILELLPTLNDVVLSIETGEVGKKKEPGWS